MTIHVPSRRRAFTIVELLVSVGVAGVLCSLAIPAIRQARGSAERAACLQTERSAVQAAHAAAAERNGLWPNRFGHDRLYMLLPSSDDAFGCGYLMQGRAWLSTLENHLWSQGETAAVAVCPTLYRRAPRGPDGRTGFDHSPVSAGWWSYYMSAAFYSAPELWDPDHPERRLAPLELRRPVGLHEVRFPAGKAAFAETASRHDDGRDAWDPLAGAMNVTFVDGHGDFLRPPDAVRALALPDRVLGFPTDDPVPFSSPPHGVRGRDY